MVGVHVVCGDKYAHTDKSEGQSEYLQDPLLPLQGRHFSERFDDVQRNIPVHAQLQNLIPEVRRK